MICNDCWDDPCTCIQIDAKPGKTELLVKYSRLKEAEAKLNLATEALEYYADIEELGERQFKMDHGSSKLPYPCRARDALKKIREEKESEE